MFGLFEKVSKPDPLAKRDANVGGIEDPAFHAAYEQLARKIGIATHAKALQLVAALREEGIQVHDLAAVERYMDAKGHWSWFPLRNQDQAGGGSVWRISRVTSTAHPSLYGNVEAGRYPHPVPWPVLCTIEKLIDRFGESVKFVVAAMNAHPDPFLACWLKGDGEGITLFVIERWDEPGFRG